MLELLALLLVFGAIVCGVLSMAWKDPSPMEARMATLRGERPVYDVRAGQQMESLSARVFAPMAGSLGAKLEALMPSRWLKAIDTGLIRAGQPVSTTGFLVACALCEGAMIALAFLLLASGMSLSMGGLVTAVLAFMGLFLPRMWLSNRVRHRQKAILKSLPDAFDLITVCVEAGLGLDAALARVAEKVEGPFGEELHICLKEVSLGKLRRDALKEMGDRAGVPDLISFINAVIQAETMGTSIATVLRVQADQMRIKRRQRAEQQAMAAPIKMMFPLVLCIFPTLFIVILGPAAITLYEQLVNR